MWGGVDGLGGAIRHRPDPRGHPVQWTAVWRHSGSGDPCLNTKAVVMPLLRLVEPHGDARPTPSSCSTRTTGDGRMLSLEPSMRCELSTSALFFCQRDGSQGRQGWGSVSSVAAIFDSRAFRARFQKNDPHVRTRRGFALSTAFSLCGGCVAVSGQTPEEPVISLKSGATLSSLFVCSKTLLPPLSHAHRGSSLQGTSLSVN